MHHLHNGRQAIGGAGRGRQQAMTTRVIEVIIDAVHDVEGLFTSHFTLDRATHDHPPQPDVVEVRGEGLWGLDHPAGFKNHLHTAGLPGHSRDVLLPRPRQHGTIHREAIGAGADVAPPATMNRIEFEQMCCGGGISAWIIHVHKLDPRSSPQGTKDEPSDATKTVDSNSHRTSRKRGAVLPINLF